MKPFKITTHTPEQTVEIGRALGKIALPGDIYLLVGQLGAGKTCFTGGIARGLDINEYAQSPTFVIMREMQGRLPLYHMDFYRLDNIPEISDLGLDDYLYGRGVCVIEWAEKGMAVLPDDHLLISINYVSDTERAFAFMPQGARYEKLVEDFANAVKYIMKG
jgi:tRNA threonylcarbamoyladenosine biosynthesis protein TsaE